MAASRKKRNWQRRYRGLFKARTPCASQNSNPGFTEPTLPRKRSWQVSALFRPRPGRTRQLCRPLHSAALIRSGERRCGEHLRGAFHCVPTAANCRDRPQIGRTPSKTSKDLVAALRAWLEPSRCSRFSLIALGRCEDSKKWPRDFVRPGPAIARDASHGQETAIGREAPPGQDNRQ